MLRTPMQLFDSIVCDPPYGVRARTHKVGISEKKREIYESRREKIKDLPKPEQYDESGNFHASMKEQYSQKDIYGDLLENASKMLRPGGRIVFLFHNDDEKSEEENRFPSHPEFEYVCASKDQLTKHRSRFLITMQKRA